MNINEQLDNYYRDGYIVLEDLIDPDRLDAVRESYEETIDAALILGRAERDEITQAMKGHRFQNPHHPALARGALMEGIGMPDLIEFAGAESVTAAVEPGDDLRGGEIERRKRGGYDIQKTIPPAEPPREAHHPSLPNKMEEEREFPGRMIY